MLVSLAKIALAPDASARRMLASLADIKATLVRTTTGGPGRRPTVMLAPALTGELPGGLANPLAGVHPFRLHRAYLAAGRLPHATLIGLPMRLLDTEMGLKGEGSDPQASLAALIAEVAISLR